MSKQAKISYDFLIHKDHYSDGESERELLNIFKSENKSGLTSEILKNNPSWPMKYHLSGTRENLLSWYDFNKNGTLLEVGAGCGALTGLFCQKLSEVVAIELTKMRADIIFERHKENENLNIFAGNLEDINLNQKFDYVTSIGVLEYAESFTRSAEPALDFIKKLKSYLKPGGTLIIAIENKFGLKYWAGAKEDHTAKLFDSLQDYPSKPGVRTYGKHELQSLLIAAGFTKNNFYYPIPDYKLPEEIFSDAYLPSDNHNIKSALLPAPDFAYQRQYLFDEKLVTDNLIKNNAFGFFANSFLTFSTY